MYMNEPCTCVGYAMNGGLHGEHHLDLTGFVQREDVLTMTVNYKANTISFHSQKIDRTVTKKSKATTKCVKFVAEFFYSNTTITLL